MRVVLALALLASLSSCKKKTEDTADKAPPPVKLRFVTASEQPVPDVLTFTGLIAADQRSEVTADTQGKVMAVLVERGQRVKMGQGVIQLDVRTAALSAREAQANLATARAQKQLAEEECRRAQTLLDKGAITRSEYDRQITQCTSTLQQVSAAQARVDMVTKSINDGLVRAPFDGLVTEKSVAAGEWVAPGRTLFTLVDDDPLKIELSVPETAVRAIQKGQKVKLSAVARRDKTFDATISRIGGEIGRTRSLIVEATLDPQTELVPGMFAEARVSIGEKRLPVVPADAVVKDGRVQYVFVAVNDELQKRIVQTSPAFEPDRLAILQGLSHGERVVVGLRKVTGPIGDDRTAKDAQALNKGTSPSGGTTQREKVVATVGDQLVEVKDGVRFEEVLDKAPQAPTPEAKAPEAKMPETKAPDTKAPAAGAETRPETKSDANTPVKAPGAKSPDARATEARMPETTTPDSKKPEDRKPAARPGEGK